MTDLGWLAWAAGTSARTAAIRPRPGHEPSAMISLASMALADVRVRIRKAITPGLLQRRDLSYDILSRQGRIRIPVDPIDPHLVFA